MASSGNGSGPLPPNFILNPHQQSLLFAALNANKQPSNASPSAKALSLSPTAFQNSPMQTIEGAGIQESPYLDNFDYDFGDSSLDFSFVSADGGQGKASEDIPGTVRSESTESEAHEKRSHPDDDDDDTLGNDSKRRESSDKVAKKPGRKPLTVEPTSKRKAQNRAAQRAFRERKEKHLKDLETKVDELEKASEAVNHENTKLRAQVDRITTELNQYKTRLAVVTNKSTSRDKLPSGGNAVSSTLSDIGFQFEFPKFGSLPGPPITQQPSSQPISPAQNGQKNSPAQTGLQSSNHDDFAKLNGILAPSLGGSTRTGSRTSLDSVPFSVAAATSSPSASSNSNIGGPSSSCGTSPEPLAQSPKGSKPLETLTTIGEEQPASSNTDQPFTQFTTLGSGNSNFDWLVQQNGGGFDPQLFGDYREPHENILTNTSFDDFLVNDAFDADFFTPYNAAPVEYNGSKKNLIDEIDAQQNAIDDDVGKNANMNCNQLWEKLQECPNAQSGGFDLDGLCSELTKKAKCSGNGPVVGERDFDTILQKYMGKDVSADSMAKELNISVKAETLNGVTNP